MVMLKTVHCGILLKQINDVLAKRANNELRSQGLTLIQSFLLLSLEEMNEQTASFKEMEKILHVAQSTAAGIIARLEQKQMVSSFRSADDGRIKMLRLTSQGQKFCKEARLGMAEAEKMLLSGLSAEEAALFKNLLWKVSSYIK